MVDVREVKKLLSKGFLQAPSNAKNYNPIFDKGEGITTVVVPSLVEVKKKEKGKVLEITRI